MLTVFNGLYEPSTRESVAKNRCPEDLTVHENIVSDMERVV